MLYASKVIQRAYYDKGYTNRVSYEGGSIPDSLARVTYDNMRNGAGETTEAEQQTYFASVPQRVPDPPTFLVGVNGDDGMIAYYTPPIYKGIYPIVNYILTVFPGNITITSDTLPIVVPNLQAGVTYKFTMRAHNAAGLSEESVVSNEVYVISASRNPTITSVVPGNAQATVNFDPPEFTGGVDIISYTVTSDPEGLVGDGASSPIVVSGLTNGTAYTFTVTATNANGNSLPSDPSSPVTPLTVPDPPTDVLGVRGNGQATVQFVPPLIDGGAPVTSFTVTANPGGATATGSASPLVVTGLTNGTPYTFTATATNSVGASVASEVSSAVTPATNPGAPTAVSATAGNGQAVVSFTAPADNGGSTIVSYTVTSSPGGFTATGGASPITVLGLTNGTIYAFTVVATNGVGNSVPSSVSNIVTPAGSPVPSAPTDVTAVPGNTQATISFTPSGSGSPSSYTVTANPGGLTVSGAGSPLTITGLTNGVNYTFSVVGTNGSGNSNPGVSNQITAGAPLAPVLTTSFPTVNDITLSFTQASNGTPSIINYKYSLNGGPFTSLSPADAVSPVLINSLSPTTAYSIRLKATNSNGDSVESAPLSVTTYTTMNIQSFTTVGTTTWTAPAGVTFVQYVVVGGGGGGGSCYSDIFVMGDLPYVPSAPSPTAYWINSAPGVTNGYLFRGYGYANTPNKPYRASVTAILNNVPPTITPSGASYPYNKFYADQIVYTRVSQLPTTTNYFPPYTINTTRCNNISGGGGGGAGGQVLSRTGTSTYTVTPLSSYTVTVGAGGAGGVATATTEAAGSPGGSSTFDTIVAAGGSGGNFSRGGYSTNGFRRGGYGGQSGGNFFGGSGGEGTVLGPGNYGYFNAGAPGGYGTYLNFDGTYKGYSTGGVGGTPNTVNTFTALANTGNGGMGTGATLNSFANGNDGAAGVVVLKWYT